MTRKRALRGKSSPDFSRVPDQVVARGKKMLQEGVSATRVMRALQVSYPTVLKWKRALGISNAWANDSRKVADELDAKAKPQRRTEVDPNLLIRALVQALLHDRGLRLTEDRGKYVAELADLQRRVTAHNQSPELAIVDALGKWHRKDDATPNGHH